MNHRSLRWLAVLLAFTFLAAACGGETSSDEVDPDDTTTDDTTPDDPDPDDTTPDDTTPDDTTPPDDDAPNIYDDPRDGIFDEFQQTFDRGNHPFTQVDSVCLSHDAAADRVDTDTGITADAINVGHIRSRLEQSEAFGFFIPVGDPEEIFNVFVDYINSECGGIRGREINLGYAEADLISPEVEASRDRACIEMTEDHNSVIVMNSTGFQGGANLCIVEEHNTSFISTQGQTEEFMSRGEDRLISLSPTLEESLEFAVADLLASGALEGKSIGTAAPSTPGQREAIEAGLVQPLRDAGFDVVFDDIDCGGSSICSGGIPESVQNMLDAEIDVFFNVLNILTAPGYINEMVTRGFEPGDVTFYATDFNSQAAELVAAQISNNPDAGALYAGATIIDFRTTGEYRLPGYEPNPFATECNRVYSENSPSGASHEWDDAGDSAFGMVGSVCGIIRIMARAIYDAGDNPTIADVQSALANLGPVDNNALAPASLVPGKTQSADVIQTLEWSFPCDDILPFQTAEGDTSCINGLNDFRPAPR